MVRSYPNSWGSFRYNPRQSLIFYTQAPRGIGEQVHGSADETKGSLVSVLKLVHAQGDASRQCTTRV